MKKKALAALLAIILILSLAACGGSKSSESMVSTADTQPAEAEGGYANGLEAADSAAAEEPAPQAGAGGGEQTAPVSDKLIYSGYAEIETLDFEGSIKAIDALIARVGGFIESSSVTGSNYSSGRDYRSASYTVRVPAAAYQDAAGSLDAIGNVTYQNSSADNITSQYYDTQSRLEAYNIEYDRLTEMLKKASTVEEMLAIEDRLTEVRYSIESLTTTLRGWDSLINYSTLTLSLTEVKDLSSAQGAGLSYWQEVGAALKSTLKGVGRFFSSLLLFLIAALPVLAILAALAAVTVLIVKKARARRAKKLSEPKDGPKE